MVRVVRDYLVDVDGGEVVRRVKEGEIEGNGDREENGE